MSILEANGAVACAECGKQARAVRDRLKAENESLRKLVRDMADAIVDWYDLIDGAFACESVYEDEKFAPLFDRMRELGVVE